MNQKKAWLFFGFAVLFWTVFWNVSLRTVAVRKNAQSGDSPALRGLMIAV